MAYAQNILPDRKLEMRVFLTGLMLVIIGVILTLLLMTAGVGFGFITLILFGLLFLQYWFSDQIALFAMGAKEVSPFDAPQLHALVDQLCLLAEMPKPRVAIADVDMANAFAAGRSSKASVICVTRGLQNQLTDEELKAVLSHELAHIAHRDIAVMTLASSVGILAGLLTRVTLWNSLAPRKGSNRNSPPEAFIMFVAIAFYAIRFLLIRALSRYREFAADRSGAILIGEPSLLASALIKISGEITKNSENDVRTSEPFNAFFFTPTFSGEKGMSLARLFSTHPPLADRLAQLKTIEVEMGISSR